MLCFWFYFIKNKYKNWCVQGSIEFNLLNVLLFFFNVLEFALGVAFFNAVGQKMMPLQLFFFVTHIPFMYFLLLTESKTS